MWRQNVASLMVSSLPSLLRTVSSDSNSIENSKNKNNQFISMDIQKINETTTTKMIINESYLGKCSSNQSFTLLVVLLPLEVLVVRRQDCWLAQQLVLSCDWEFATLQMMVTQTKQHHALCSHLLMEQQMDHKHSFPPKHISKLLISIPSSPLGQYFMWLAHAWSSSFHIGITVACWRVFGGGYCSTMVIQRTQSCCYWCSWVLWCNKALLKAIFGSFYKRRRAFYVFGCWQKMDKEVWGCTSTFGLRKIWW